jgi:hypothetical protein
MASTSRATAPYATMLAHACSGMGVLPTCWEKTCMRLCTIRDRMARRILLESAAFTSLFDKEKVAT